MRKFNVVENVIEDDESGYMIVEVIENDIMRKVEYSFDCGGSLYNVVIVDDNRNVIEEEVSNVFSDEMSEMIINMDFDY